MHLEAPREVSDAIAEVVREARSRRSR
jgi:hypothetical protein